MIENDISTGKITLLIFVRTKEGWLVGLGQEGVERGWRDCLKYLKREWNRKEGRGNKDFKKGGGQAGSRGGCLKTREAGTPLQTVMEKYKKVTQKINLKYQLQRGTKNLNYLRNHILYEIFKNIFSISSEKMTDIPTIAIYVNKIENRITFKIKTVIC